MTLFESSGYFRRLARSVGRTEFTDQQGRPLSAELAFEQVESLLSRHVETPGDGRRRGKVMLVGNGGSAAIASHIQNDLAKVLGVRAMVFNEAPLLTALANDLEYDAAFEHNAALWAEFGDLMFAISSSGRSANICRAAKAAIAHSCRVITLSGFGPDNPLRTLGEINMYVPSSSYGHVEVSHLALLHCLADRLAARFAQYKPAVWQSAAAAGR